MRKNNNEKEKTNIIKQTKTQLIMKFKPFILGTMAMMAALFTACSSDEPVAGGGQDNSDATGSENYVSVSLQMPVASGTRDGEFDNGEDYESNVKNVVFFFFDTNNKIIDIQKLDNPKFIKDPQTTPAISHIGKVEVRLKQGIDYVGTKVAVALNTSASDAAALLAKIKDLNDLQRRQMAYLDQVYEDTDNFSELITDDDENPNIFITMSNSVFYDTNDMNVAPNSENQKFLLVTIKENNIYTSAERATLTSDQDIPVGKSYVDIYVERVISRIDVNKPVFDANTYYISKENNVETKTITIWDHAGMTSKTVTVKPVLTGVCLNVLPTMSRLIKPIRFNQVGYGVGSGGYKDFQWNDPKNKRSYWASTDELTSPIKYFSWNDAKTKWDLTQNSDDNKITQYVYPNTVNWEPTAANEKNSDNTKIMVSAELHAYEEDGTHAPISLVRYGGDYMEESGLLTHAANQINIAVRNIDWENLGLTLNDAALTNDQINAIKVAATNAFVTGFSGANLKLEIEDNSNGNTAPDHADWAAAIRKINMTFDLGDLEEQLKGLATTQINSTIDTELAVLNEPLILYWKDGKTYFYTSVRHQGFVNLMGTSTAEDATDFLYGVVRNHIYNITIQGIYGLGTPVIEPGKPIDPDRPDPERPSYLKARINILPWRVVNNNVTIH